MNSRISDITSSILPKHFSHHQPTTDILVAGGGLSGVACALAAAREGANVILCQDRPVLGGNASSEVRMHIVGANTGRGGKPLELETRESGIIEEIRLENAARNPQRSPSMFDFILYEKCRAEPNLTLLLNTTVTAATVEKGTITSVEAVRLSTEDRFTIFAKVFVDCTGDGGLGAAAGAAYFHGREDKARFHEPDALDVADSLSLGSTLLFMARRHDRPMPFTAPAWARKFTEHDLRLRSHGNPGVDEGLEYGYWWMEWGGQLDTIKDNEEIRDELLAILMGVWDHIKNQPGHHAENWALDWFGFLPGKRESRRFVGQHVLTETDVMTSRPFSDAIAYGGWPIDTHPPEGVDKPDEPPCIQTPVPQLYDIPLRCCIARDFTNLLFAGRNISATHLAFASTRVMATCAAIGQGVGTAATFAVKHGMAPAELPAHSESMHRIRQALLNQDAYVIGEAWEDAENVAQNAKLTASSELPEGAADNVFSGQTRCVQGKRGVVAERQLSGTHRWISDASHGESPWLQLDWKQPQRVSGLVLVFDTGLHRHLTLTQSDEYAHTMYWGSGQPETVKHFRVEALDREDHWETLVEVKDNFQRLWKHQLAEPRDIHALKFTFISTWADAPHPEVASFDGTHIEALAHDRVHVMRLAVYA